MKQTVNATVLDVTTDHCLYRTDAIGGPLALDFQQRS
jgi:hypothetical protein